MAQYGVNVNYTSKISGTDYDLNSLFVSSGLTTYNNNATTLYNGNYNIQSFTFSNTGNYMVFLTATPNNNNANQTKYTISFSTTSQGITTHNADINSLYISNFLGGSVNPDDATVSACAVLNVASTATTWYLAIRMAGSDTTYLRWQLSCVGPI